MQAVDIKKRDYLFDNLKCIGIVLVVFAHLIENVNTPTTNILYKIVYLFHMPLFVFVSGYYAKFGLKKILKKLVIPYLVMQVLWALVEYFISGSQQNFVTYFLTPRWVLWYLFSMIIWRLFTFFLEKCEKKYLPLILMFSFIVGIILGFCNFDGYILSISRTIVFLPFFILGFCFKRFDFKNLRIFKDSFIRLGFAVLSIICVVSFFVLFPNAPREALYNSFMYNDLPNYNAFVRIYMYFCATLIIITLLMFVSNKSSIFSIIGQNSMSIYLIHGLIVKVLALTFVKTGLPCPVTICIILSSIIILASIYIGKGCLVLLEKVKNKLKKQKQSCS